MGQYKVPQDVEAEDKILGPLTIHQFIYAIIGVFWGGICFVVFKAVPVVMIVIGVPPTLLFLLLAFYKRDGQDFEHFLVALVGYFGQSRRRLWIKEQVLEAFKLVTPPVVTAQSQRNPDEVRSQLDHLANLMDAHGNTADFEQAKNDDRLFMPDQPHSEGPLATSNEVDMLDAAQNPGVDQLSQLIEKAAEEQRAKVVKHVQTQAAKPPVKAAPKASSTSVMTAPVSGDIIRLATENDDLKVSQIAAQANRIMPLTEGQTVNLNNATSQS